MKRIIAAAAFALVASPALAQSFDRSPTDPIMPSHTYDPTVPSYDRAVDSSAAEERRQVASSGTTRSDLEISTEASVGATGARAGAADFEDRHVERHEGYFDPSN